MRWTWVALLVAAAAAAAARATDVVQLTNANFNDIVTAEPALLVEFFAPCTRVISKGGREGGRATRSTDLARIAHTGESGRERERKRKGKKEKEKEREEHCARAPDRSLRCAHALRGKKNRN